MIERWIQLQLTIYCSKYYFIVNDIRFRIKREVASQAKLLLWWWMFKNDWKKTMEYYSSNTNWSLRNNNWSMILNWCTFLCLNSYKTVSALHFSCMFVSGEFLMVNKFNTIFKIIINKIDLTENREAVIDLR